MFCYFYHRKFSYVISSLCGELVKGNWTLHTPLFDGILASRIGATSWMKLDTLRYFIVGYYNLSMGPGDLPDLFGEFKRCESPGQLDRLLTEHGVKS